MKVPHDCYSNLQRYQHELLIIEKGDAPPRPELFTQIEREMYRFEFLNKKSIPLAQEVYTLGVQVLKKFEKKLPVTTKIIIFKALSSISVLKMGDVKGLKLAQTLTESITQMLPDLGEIASQLPDTAERADSSFLFIQQTRFLDYKKLSTKDLEGIYSKAVRLYDKLVFEISPKLAASLHQEVRNLKEKCIARALKDPVSNFVIFFQLNLFSWERFLQCLCAHKNMLDELPTKLDDILLLLFLDLRPIFQNPSLIVGPIRFLAGSLYDLFYELKSTERTRFEANNLRALEFSEEVFLEVLNSSTNFEFLLAFLKHRELGTVSSSHLRIIERKLVFQDRVTYLWQTALTKLSLEAILCVLTGSLLDMNLRWKKHPFESGLSTLVPPSEQSPIYLLMDEALTMGNIDVSCRVLHAEQKKEEIRGWILHVIRTIIKKCISEFSKAFEKAIHECKTLVEERGFNFPEEACQRFLNAVYKDPAVQLYKEIEEECPALEEAVQKVSAAKQVILSQLFRLSQASRTQYAMSAQDFTEYHQGVFVFEKHIGQFIGYKRFASFRKELVVDKQYECADGVLFREFQQRTLPFLIEKYLSEGEISLILSLAELIAPKNERFAQFFKQVVLPFMRDDEEDVASELLSVDEPSVEESRPSVTSLPSAAPPAASSFAKEIDDPLDPQISLVTRSKKPPSPPADHQIRPESRKVRAERRDDLSSKKVLSPKATLLPKVDELEKDCVTAITEQLSALRLSSSSLPEEKPSQEKTQPLPSIKTPVELKSSPSGTRYVTKIVELDVERLLSQPTGPLHPRVHDWKQKWFESAQIDEDSYDFHTYSFFVTKCIKGLLGVKLPWQANVRYACFGEIFRYKKGKNPQLGIFEEAYTARGRMLYHHFFHPRSVDECIARSERKQSLFDQPAGSPAQDLTPYEQKFVSLLQGEKGPFSGLQDTVPKNITYNGRLLLFRQKDSVMEIDDPMIGVIYRLFGKNFMDL